jgi:pyridoxal phosphate enzyme (YggS family)
VLQAAIARNLQDVRQRIAEAAARSGRSADAVRLIAVTKYVGLAEVQALVALGCRDLGESRPQELWQKAAELAAGLKSDVSAKRKPDISDVKSSLQAAGLESSVVEPSTEAICWHLIGHLQRNKVRRTLPLVSWVHSADSLRLLEEIDREAAALGWRPGVLLEINVSGDPTKHGFRAEELDALLPRLAHLPSLNVRGLMCMAAREGDLDVARRNFAELRELRDRLRQAVPDNVRLDELSMGMSGDFEAAIKEGATMVRIGSALFE